MRHAVCAALALLLSAAPHAQAPQAPAADKNEKSITPPPGITTEGIPAIPQSIAEGFGRYAQFRQAQMIGWNPAKRQILITTTLGTVPQLYSVDGPGRDRHQLTWFDRGVPVIANASYDPADGNTFVYQFDPAGSSELRSLYRFDMATGESTLVTESKTRYLHIWSRQGKWLAYDSAERNGKDRDLYVIQPSDPKTKRRLGEFQGAFSPEDWSPDGTTLLATEPVSNNEVYIWRIDVKTGERKAVTPRDGEKATWYTPRYSLDGKKIYAVSDRQGGDFRIWACNVANCVWSPVTPEGTVVSVSGTANGATGNFEISPDGTVMAVAVDKGSSTDLQIVDLTTLKWRSIPALPKGVVQQLRWRPGSKELGYTLSSLKSQGDVYSLDVALGTLTRWTTSETSFNPDVLPPPEVVDIKSFDGTTINAIVYRPPAKFTGPRPVVVQFHGGPQLRERVRWLGRSNYLLNELGIALVFPNVRGSDGFGRKFAEMDNGKGREGAIKDAGAVLDWIATRPDLDKNRVMFGGGSSGGWLALEAGIYFNGRIRGIFEGAGMTDFISYLEKETNPARQNNRRAEYGDERDPDMRAFLTSISPVTRAADLKKPTLIMQPGKDMRVPVTQARELLNALKANNAPVWYAEFADADHESFPGSVAAGDWVVQVWIAFFKAYLLN